LRLAQRIREDEASSDCFRGLSAVVKEAKNVVFLGGSTKKRMFEAVREAVDAKDREEAERCGVLDMMGVGEEERSEDWVTPDVTAMEGPFSFGCAGQLVSDVQDKVVQYFH